jgi:hypothetical protein
MRVRIYTARQYQRAVSEMQRLDRAREGTLGHRRRHELLAAMSEFEQQFALPRYVPGKPAPCGLRDAAPSKRRRRRRGQ